MFRQSLRLALAATALAGSFALASPAVAAPATHHVSVTQAAPSTGGDWGRHRRFGRFGFGRFGFPFGFGSFGFPGFGFDGFGFGGGTFGGECVVIGGELLCPVI